MLTRLILLATIISAVLLVGQGPSPVRPPAVSAEVAERTEFRHPPPSCEEIVNSPQWRDKPVNCIELPPPTYDPPEMHGKYRLFPGSYVGPLTYQDSPNTAPPGVVSNELEAIRASSLYAEPAWLPEGYALSSINTNGYHSEHVILAEYTGPADPIHVNRIRRPTWPIDIILPPDESSAAVFETPTLAGTEAVLNYPKAGSSWARSEFDVLLRFVEGDVETIVYGASLDPDTITQIALSLICGAECVSASETAEAGLPGGTASASGTPAAGLTAGFEAAASARVPTEHRSSPGWGGT